MIHKYFMNGYYIVLDVNSGAVHTVDRIVYDILEFYEDKTLNEIIDLLSNKHDKNEIIESYNEIQYLVENKLIFSDDIYKNYITIINNKPPVIKALCLHIAHDCNLKCQYCFAQEGEYHGERSLMSAETGKRAIDFLIKNSANRKNLEVDFFGGEPTLNFDVIKEIIKYAHEKEERCNKNFRFTLTTNGILLNDNMIDYINNNMHNVVLSIDGRKEINDLMRPKSGGQGSYDTIVSKFQKIANARKQDNYYVRGTFTRNNLDFSEDVLHLANLGFKQISIEPVVGDNNKNYTIKEDDLERIYKEYERLAIKMLERKNSGDDFNFFHFMIDLTGGPCVSKRLRGCGVGSEYLAVSPNGDLYPCHQFTGIDEFKMGSIYDNHIDESSHKKFENCNVYSKNICQDCWAKFYCSGGCPSNAYMANSDILKPYEIGCKLQKKRTECAIMMKVAHSE